MIFKDNLQFEEIFFFIKKSAKHKHKSKMHNRM